MIKIGIVGAGYWGPKLARNFNELSDAELSYVCDLNPNRLNHLEQLYPQIQTTQVFQDMLDSDVDAIIIATPVFSHYPLVIEALRAGKHVLVEKPLASTVKEAEEIVLEGQKRNLTVMVGHTFEYNPAVETIKSIIEQGELGEIYYINGTRVNLGIFQPDINVMWDLAPHDISILRFILGMSPERVSARGEVYVQRNRGLHDVAYLTLHFPNRVMANVRVSWLDPRKIRRYTIVGSEKMLVYDDIESDKILIYDKGVDIPPYSDTEEEFHLSYRYGDGIPYEFDWVEPLKKECRHFLSCIKNGSEPRSSARVGLEIVQILDAAQRSLSNGGGREIVHKSSRIWETI